MTPEDREKYVLHLAEVAFEADMKHMVEIRHGDRDDYLEWEFYVRIQAPIVARYRAIALAVEQAMYDDLRTVFGRRKHFARDDNEEEQPHA